MSTNTTVTNKWIKQYPVIVIVLTIALVLSYLAITPVSSISRPVAFTPSNTSGIQRGWEAYAARYQAMALAYAAKEASTTISVQRSRAAETARLNGMAEANTAMESARIQRSWEAYTARYTAMGKQYAISENIRRGWNAYAARYQAMAEYYAAKEAANFQRSWDAYTTRYTVMAERETKKVGSKLSP